MGPVSEFINVLGLGLYAYTFHEEVADTSLIILNKKSANVEFCASPGVASAINHDDALSATDNTV